ncbi:peptidase C12, ubiquitin carboxyl-terminal hydrolase 1 [Sistotremastrum suecicum HHB10207 ss-3]|uniref:Ubiquitin carboxyl-terminal hydrolase n=1 Tax=Sistotremastrum suecicum HHB10207 ss-3 TaxID=1314776 RepID=A0A166EAE8_9AGAM|nr:peptidase C12, ubiquitin carboxyl-terminal hydrolase 1 [Sistotremastrum suecicum HHB10207 ss-3]
MTSRWIPLESNPEVMNEWSEKAGLDTSEYEFQDVYGLDPELLGMVPQPVQALILIFPITDEYETKRLEVDRKISEDGQVGLDEGLIYIRQTIGNACGTMALLHAVANTKVKTSPDSPLSTFITQCKGKTPAERSKLLEETDIFASIHLEAAQSGQSSAPSADEDVNLHYTCFVLAASSPASSGTDPNAEHGGGTRLVELDGRRVGPVDHGPSTDLLQDAAKVVKDVYIGGATSLNFGMIALAPPFGF